MPCWKGRLALASRKALNELLVGVDQEEELRPRVSEAAWRDHTGPLVVTEWYPETNATEIVEVAAAVLRRPVDDVAHEVGRRSMMHQYGGLGMTIAAIIVTPSLVVRYAGTNWTKFRNTGTLTPRIVEPGHIVNEIAGWAGHTPALCCGTLGAFEEIWRTMRRVRNARVRRTACISAGAPACRFEVSYEI